MSTETPPPHRALARLLDRTPVPPGTVVAGRFDVEALADSGGVGWVYRARDLERATIVALKMLRRAASNPSCLEREAWALSRVAHAGIVGYVDHGRCADGEPYLVMEWLEGEPLAERLRRGPLTRAESAAIVVRVADALTAVHAAGLVHRSVEQRNIFITRDGHVKLLDFGSAALAAHDNARGDDFFALGCVFVECIGGRPPFWTHAHAELWPAIRGIGEVLADPARLEQAAAPLTSAVLG